MKVIADVSGHTIAELIALSGRSAVVTGGGRGLRKAIACRLAEAGANVLIGDRDPELARAAAEDLAARFPSRCLHAAMDVTDSGAVTAAADLASSQFGGIDIWVNNAGIFPFLPLAEMSDQTWNDVMAVNTRGVLAGAREAARCMIAAMATSALGRVGVPDDVARAVLFCASDLSLFMTGSTLLVDAGETA